MTAVFVGRLVRKLFKYPDIGLEFSDINPINSFQIKRI